MVLGLTLKSLSHPDVECGHCCGQSLAPPQERARVQVCFQVVLRVCMCVTCMLQRGYDCYLLYALIDGPDPVYAYLLHSAGL